ncbi:MAG: hypothetical protein ACREMI_06220 [Gemmatimonadales bacterium]
MSRALKIARVVLGLVGVGAVFGAIAGAVAITIATSLDGGPWLDVALFVGIWFGAPLGAIAAPVLGFSLLRRVPLGRLFVGCAAGTAIGGVVGWIVSAPTANVAINGLAGAVIGCVVSAVNLWYRSLPAVAAGGAHDRLEA